jgi:hypothetical protein
MERRHIIKLIPARVPAGIIPHTVAAPAMINEKFIDVIAPVTDTLFFENLFDKVNHVSGIVRPVIAAIDEEDVKLHRHTWFSLSLLLQIPTVMYGTARHSSGFTPEVCTHVAFPDYLVAGWSVSDPLMQ